MRFQYRWLAAAAFAAVLPCTVAPLAAQNTGELDTTPPTVSITPGNSSYSSASLQVTVTWNDNQALAPSSRSITLNGVEVGSSFSYSGSAKLATSVGTVTLSSGSNVLVARIDDAEGNVRAPVQVTYTYPPFVP
ncbi:MAG TPA: hypothetical protein VFS20_30225, partial [Longimicrobium sp.]|nr:hypothetical protein [Longimicrobium sp.]